MTQITWDDVAEGQEISIVEEMPSQRLVVWAAASGDFYQIHYDPDFARNTGLKHHVDLHLEVEPSMTVHASHEIAMQVRDKVVDALVAVSKSLAPTDLTMSAARSLPMCVRRSSMATNLSRVLPKVDRETTRSRNGSGCGAPARRVLGWLAATMHLIDAGVYNPWLFRGGLLVVGALTLVVLAAVTHQRSFASPVLGNPVLRWLGTRSYGLYLYHWPIFLFLGIDRRPPVLALGLRATVVATWFSYRFIEQPFLRLKARWQRLWPMRYSTHWG